MGEAVKISSRLLHKIISLFVYVIFIIAFENYSVSKKINSVAQYANFFNLSMWEMDQSSALHLAKLICLEGSLIHVNLSHPTGESFIHYHSGKGVESTFKTHPKKKEKSLPERLFLKKTKQNIRYQNELIGTIEVDWIENNLLIYILALLIIVLINYVIKFYEQQTERTRELAKSNKEKMEISRQAGMAEIASGVLHNVGNILNSVNISVESLLDLSETSTNKRLGQIAPILQTHSKDLNRYLTEDNKGKLVPQFILELARASAADAEVMREEILLLQKNVENIKNIIAIQQIAAGSKIIIDSVSIGEIAEQAITVNYTALERHKVNLIQSYDKDLIVTTDKLKVMQILINLISNAKYAVRNSLVKKIIIASKKNIDNVEISVTDSGEGITRENLQKVFQFGYTSKKDGHGFGLHNSALAAKELHASLEVFSTGKEKGTTFVLTIPIEYKKKELAKS